MFRKKQSLGLRVWHWANSLIIILLLFTVLLRKTFFSVKANQALLLSKAQSLGLVLTEDQSVNFAKVIRNQMWQWHPILGFVVVGLLAFRTIIFFMDKKKFTEKMATKSFYFRLVKKSYVLFYLLLFVMGATGIFLYWDEFFRLSEPVEHTMKEVHETLMWFFVPFIAAHIVGVIRAEQGEDRGLVSDMINGGKDL
ncbi:MAG: cytochrome b/b6 domain-containing protein [Bacteriovorax sp.]